LAYKTIFLMSETLSKPIELFYAGTHTDFRRKVVTVNTPDLESSVSWFNANNQRLPLVVGHPDSEDDHFGMGTKLALVDGRVVITEVEGLDRTFRKIVNSGELPRVSAKIRLQGHPSNRSKGIEFQHAGFFGKSRVALEKLKEASFSEYDDLEFWFMDTKKKKVEGSDGEESTEPVDEEADEPVTEEEQALEKKKKALAAEMAAFEAEKASFARAREIEPVIEKLVREGRVLPAEKSGFVALFARMPDDLEISFSSATGDVEQSGGDFLKGFLTNLKPRVTYGEVSGLTDTESKSTTANFAAPGLDANGSEMELFNRVMASGVDVGDSAAFSRAIKQAMEAK
jgi:hypothetical protein